KMCFALFVSVLGNVERGRKVNHQRCGIGLRVNAEEREKRRVLTQFGKHHLPFVVGLVLEDRFSHGWWWFDCLVFMVGGQGLRSYKMELFRPTRPLTSERSD